MSERDVPREVRTFIVDQFPAAHDRDLNADDTLLESGIIDSLGVLELVQFIEERFGIALSDEELVADHFDTVAAVSALICTKLSANESEPVPPAQ